MLTIEKLFQISESMLNKSKLLINTKEKKRLLENFVSLSLLQGLNYILPLVTFPYLVRVLGVEKFGLLAFATATVAYFQILTDYGFNLSATREVAINRDNKEKLNEIFSSVMIIKFCLLIISFLLLSVLVFSFEKFRQDWLIYYLSFGMVVGQVLFPVWFFQGMEQMRYITLLNILAKGLFTVAIFVFVHNKSDYYLVPFFTSFGYFVTGIVSILIINKRMHVGITFVNKITIKYYLIEGWDLFISSIFSFFYRNINIIILGLLTNDYIVGYYSVSEKLLKIFQSLQDVFGTALFPFLSKKNNEKKEYFFSLNEKYFKFIFFIYILFAIIVFLFSPIIILFVIGQANNIAVLNLRLLSFVILIGGLNYYYGIIGLVSMNYKKDFSHYIIITGLFNLFFCILLVKLIPNIGAAISMNISELLLLFFIVWKIIKIRKNFN